LDSERRFLLVGEQVEPFTIVSGRRPKMKKLTENEYQELLRSISCYLCEQFDHIVDLNDCDAASLKRLKTDLCYQAISNANQLAMKKVGPYKTKKQKAKEAA
jgi:hypothetical protein